ncbi:TPA: DNA topoisomerase I, partial [Candidatus Micrarchaeota archaeon]|nr:DNA topoisomerase I [Candidatus Micrarchaeota archaeon]
KNPKRMYFSTLVAEDLVDAYDNAKSQDKKAVEAGRTRHEIDWIWGINLSRALMASIKKAGAFRVMSIGRVQGPALALLVRKEKDIKAFQPVSYWQLFANETPHELKFQHETDKFFDKNAAQKALENSSANQKDARVTSVERKQYKQSPPTPFDLTTLQIESYRAFGFNPTYTLQLAQSLYEAAVVSYPRTSSQKLPAKLGLEKVMRKLSENQQYSVLAKRLISEKRFTPFEGKKEDLAHPAIYPTGQKPGALKEHERKLYDLIIKRFLACFAKEATRESATVRITLGTEPYFVSGARTIEQGWIEFYLPYAEFDEITLPPFKEGQSINITCVEMVEKQTQPPKRFTQASLIKKLEDLELGTKATRAAIIQTLFDRGYATGKSIEATPLGITVFDALEKSASEILSDEMTRSLEKEMDEIHEGKQTPTKVIASSQHELSTILSKFKPKEAQIGSDLLKGLRSTQTAAATLGKCGKCEKGMLVIRKSMYGFFVGCNAYPACRNLYPLPKESLVKSTGKTCEKCGTPIVTVIRKGKRPFRMCLDTKCETKKNWGQKPASDAKTTKENTATKTVPSIAKPIKKTKAGQKKKRFQKKSGTQTLPLNKTILQNAGATIL